MDSRKVVIGMSGGVDSSVAAALLKEGGYEVVGVTLVLLPEECESDRPDACCGIQAVDDARAVCDQLGIRYHTFNFRHVFREKIIDHFCSEYGSGRTPNPCARCNRWIKFPLLKYAADIVGARYIATGHLAQIRTVSGKRRITKGADTAKDQSYFLFEVAPDTLERTLLPMGDKTKEESRRLAADLGLHVKEKPESQEICFVKDNRYASFLEEWAGDSLVPGPIIDTNGRQLGVHKGIQLYTIGQRRGMGIGGGKPLYVISIDAAKNAIIVGEDGDLYADGLIARDLTWHEDEARESGFEAEAKIRYNHTGVKARVSHVGNGGIEVLFDEPQRAVAPGQAVVFYKDDVLLGGGWIESGIKADPSSGRSSE